MLADGIEGFLQSTYPELHAYCLDAKGNFDIELAREEMTAKMVEEFYND